VSSLLGLLLAVVGHFSIHELGACSFLIFTVFLLVSARKKHSSADKVASGELIFVAAVLLIAALLWHNPFSYIFGGWDPGAYINTGVHIARTGTINYTDSFFAALPDDLKPAFSHYRSGLYQRFPGFLIGDMAQGKVLPQFHHVYPVWIAVFYMLFGLKSVFYVNAVFGLFSVMAVYFIGKKVFDKRTGTIAALLLLLNITQVWQVRFQTAEITAQFFILASLYMFSAFFQNRSALFGIGGAVSLACALFTRFDMLLYLPLVVFGLYMMFITGRRKDLVGPGLTLVLAGAGFVLYKRYTCLYIPLQHLIISNTAVYAAGGLLSAGVIFYFAYKKWPRALTSFLNSAAFRFTVVAAVCLLAVYAYSVRPKIEHSFDGGNFVALGWFMTPWGLAMAVAGISVFFINLRRIDEIVIFLVSLLSIVVYTYRLFSDDFYMWSARRFVPVVIPALCLFVGWFINRIGSRLKRARIVATAALVLVTAAPPLVNGWAVVRGDDYAGSISFLSRLAAALDPEGVYLCNGYRVAAPLNLIYNFNTIAISDIDENKVEQCLRYLTQQVERGTKVYYIGPEDGVYSDRCNFRKINELTYTSSRISRSRSALPQRIEKLIAAYNIFEISPITSESAPTPKEVTFNFGETFFGQWSGFKLTSRKPDVAVVSEPCSLIVPVHSGHTTTIVFKAAGVQENTSIQIRINETQAGTVHLSKKMQEYRIEIPDDMVYSSGNRARLGLIPDQDATAYLDWIRVISHDHAER